MRDHSYDSEEAALRPKAARIEAPVTDRMARAAVEGRSDVLGGPGLLGLQRAVGNGGVTSMIEDERSPVHDVISSGGRPLDDGHPHRHGGPARPRLRRRPGPRRRRRPSSPHRRSTPTPTPSAPTSSSSATSTTRRPTADKTMLAHELTHVVQQRSGPVDGTPSAGGIKVSDPSDRFERDAAANAERVMSAPPEAAPTTAAAPAPAVQRDVDEDAPVQRAEAPEEEEEETAQGSFVQREDAPEEEEEEPAG